MTDKSAKEIDLLCLANAISQDMAAIRVILEYILSNSGNFITIQCYRSNETTRMGWTI